MAIRKILRFNPRYEDIPEEIRSAYKKLNSQNENNPENVRNSHGELYGITCHSPYAKIVTVFFKRIIEQKGLDAVIIVEPFWLENFGLHAIDAVERIANNLGLEFWISQGLTAEFCYLVLSNGSVVETRDYRRVFADSGLEKWKERL